MAFKLPDSPILKKNLPLIVAGISALLAVVLINVYIQQQAAAERKRLEELEKSKVTVIIAAQAIPKGAQITDQMITEVRAPKDKVDQYMATSASRVLNKIAIAPIEQGEPVMLNKITAPVTKTRWEGLAAKVPPGKRAVTIPVDEIGSLSGLIRPGDYVDLVGVVSMPAQGAGGGKSTQVLTILPLFQDVLILAVEQDLNPAPQAGDKGSSGNANVTLALSPQEANIISFIQEQGKVRLVLRAPSDRQSPRTIPSDWDSVLKVILPQKPGEYRPRRTVEVYHGIQKEIKVIEQ